MKFFTVRNERVNVKLDPDLAKLVAAATAAGLAPLYELSPEQARERSRAGAINALSGPTELIVTDTYFNGIATRCYQPANPTRHIVYAHGGGWVTGDLNTTDGFCRQMALHADAVVTSVDYRLAPEWPFPAAVDDFCSVVSHAHSLLPQGVGPLPLCVGGDSAGAHLATVAARRARDAGSPNIVAQILLYPVTDRVTTSRESYAEHRDGFPIGERSMQWFWNHFLTGNDVDWQNPDIAPMALSEISGLAPALIILAGHDPLHDEGSDYAHLLTQAGVPVRVMEFGSLCHGFIRLDAVVPRAAEANREIITVISQLPNSITEGANK